MAESEDGVSRPAGPPTAPISFSFSRTAARRRLADRGDDPGAAPEEKEFLKTVEGRKLHSVNPSEAPKELVIPLIQNDLRRQPLTQAPGLSTDIEAIGDGVLSQAVKELIEESKKSLEERENAGVDPTLAIPMIQKRCTPNEEGAGSEPRAETVPKEANYEAVPVEAYGLAMLRGMGWKPGQGIGRTFKQVVKPRVNSLRPKGLGLGANLAEVQALAPTGPHRPRKPGEEQEKDKEDQPQGLVAGGYVVVLSGPYRGLYGKVEGLDPDNARAMVRLAMGKSKNSLDPSHVSKTSSGQQNGAASMRKGSELPTRQGAEEKRKHLPDRQDEPPAKSEKAASRRQHWLYRDLRVRFVDKLYKRGQYYNTKMIIEDVLSPDTCVCRTDEGQILDGIREDMLETLIPKVQGKRVMVVLGPQAGRVGHLLSWDREKSQAVVQLRRENRVVELHYDAVCEYIGPTDSDDD
ncbi:PREDICTED: G patch domain and KOW motifs-containing protein [Myotis davidii]|uniref:G patch domain and KOW motifs-containing protein n=1 Tax=Myotis davidii TaxID=225400 RepID=UPI0003EC67C8|nr:PREDICTED: G patch domain and KOW motifs-containing protein [Myotis davidii]